MSLFFSNTQPSIDAIYRDVANKVFKVAHGEVYAHIEHELLTKVWEATWLSSCRSIHWEVGRRVSTRRGR